MRTAYPEVVVEVGPGEGVCEDCVAGVGEVDVEQQRRGHLSVEAVQLLSHVRIFIDAARTPAVLWEHDILQRAVRTRYTTACCGSTIYYSMLGNRDYS